MSRPDGESKHLDLVDSFARRLARARFGVGVDMGGRHNPLPSEVIAAREMVEEAAVHFGSSEQASPVETRERNE